MLFNSLEFLLFFPTVVAIYFALPLRGRQIHLLIASYAFYMAWEPAYALLLLLTTAVDWKATNWMQGASQRKRDLLMAVSAIQNLGLLFSFKYYNLINDTFTWLAGLGGVHWPLPESNFLLPVGISFYTFQTLSYTIDVYREKEPAERSFVLFALYVTYFPQLVAGPIERSGRLLPQLDMLHRFDWDKAISGLRLIVWGLFKKCVVADRLGPIVDTIYGSAHDYSGPAVVLATLLFGYQVYCDFSGYSDIAIGSARVMGVELMTNFDQPHLARSSSKFWSRWHISLITWFRDYVFIPLGGSKRGTARTVFNVMLVFLLSGIWHGANWTYVVWGLQSGLVVLIGLATRDVRDRIAVATGFARLTRTRIVWQTASTIAVVYSGFPLFRATSLVHAATVYSRMPVGWTGLGDPAAFAFFLRHLDTDPVMFLATVLLVPLTEVIEYAQRHRHTWQPAPTWVRWSTDYALVFGVILLGRFSKDQFFYFQF